MNDLPGRLAEADVGPDPAGFVERWSRSLVAEGAECAECPFFSACRGYFKWPRRDYDCTGVKALLHTLRQAADELRGDLAAIPPPQGPVRHERKSFLPDPVVDEPVQRRLRVLLRGQNPRPPHIERLETIIDKVLDHMDANQIGALTIHWQGGEAMLLPPDWYQQAFDLIQSAAAAHGKHVDHGLQTNMLAYSPKWDRVIAEMFGNSVSTSLDYPNLYRKVRGRGPEHYDALWASKVRAARAAGIDVKVISVLNQATLEIGAERFYEHLVDELGVSDFQINTPFPGGRTNDVKRDMDLDVRGAGQVPLRAGRCLARARPP